MWVHHQSPKRRVIGIVPASAAGMVAAFMF
jgi:hypothetical protein